MALHDVSTMADLDYPSSDGQPVAESDFQRDPLFYGVQALDLYFQDRPDVYVSANLPIYYEPGNRSAAVAPDVFVVFGVPKHKRPSYLLWDEGRVPAFVLEITSRSTRKKDQEDNLPLYASWGVQEYWQYDPTGDYLDPALQGQQLVGGRYQSIPTRVLPDGTHMGFSAVLGLELRLTGGDLRFYEPTTGRRLLSYHEMEAARQKAEARWRTAEAERQALLAQLAEVEARLRQQTDQEC